MLSLHTPGHIHVQTNSPQSTFQYLIVTCFPCRERRAGLSYTHCTGETIKVQKRAVGCQISTEKLEGNPVQTWQQIIPGTKIKTTSLPRPCDRQALPVVHLPIPAHIPSKLNLLLSWAIHSLSSSRRDFCVELGNVSWSFQSCLCPNVVFPNSPHRQQSLWVPLIPQALAEPLFCDRT